MSFFIHTALKSRFNKKKLNIIAAVFKATNTLFRKIAYPLVLGLFAVSAKAQTYVFAKLQGSPVNTAGWNFAGAAKVTNVTGTDNSEILLTPNVNATSGAVFFSQPINLSMCKKWKAEFDYRIYDGTGGDGIAFCFLDVPPTNYVNGLGLGIPATANGLKICVDTWNNCNNDYTFQMPKLEVRWGPGYDECANGMVTAFNANGQLGYLRSSKYNHVIITYDDGHITVTVGNLQIINSAYQQFNFTGYLGFTASTGGFNDNQSIKNVIIYTEMPPSVAGQSAHPVCPGDTVHLGGPSNPGYSYNWSPAAGLSSTSTSNPVATVDNTTGDIAYQKYYVKTSFTATPGCTSTDSITVTVNPKPMVDFEVPVICLPAGNALINNKTTIKDGTQNQVSYKWSFSDGGSSTQASPAHNYTSAGNYSITLQATSNNNCKNALTKSFTIHPQAKAAITVPTEFCQDSSLLFSGSAGGAPVQKWYWKFGDGGVDSIQQPVHTYNTAGTYTATMRAITTEGCVSDTAKASVTINPLPQASMYYTGLLCEGGSIAFTENANPSVGSITSRTWYFDDGTTASSQQVTHAFSPYGTHKVSLAVHNSKGCNSKPYSKTIIINPNPKAGFTPPSICRGVNGVFTDASTIADGTQGQFTYSWNFGDGSTSSAPGPSHNYAVAGNYPVKLVVTSAHNCADSITKTFPVSDYPIVDFKILNTNFCSNLPLNIKDNSSVKYGTLDAIKIFWDASQPGYTNVTNPQPGATYTHSYPSFGYTNSLQVTLKVQAFSSGQCYTEKTGVSVLFAAPRLVFNPIPVYCENNSQAVILNEARDTAVFSGTGYYTGNGVNNGYFTPSQAGTGTHTITYHYTLSNGCADTISQTVKVGPKPKVTAGQDDVILQGGQIVLQGSATGGDGLTYVWTPNEHLDDNTLAQPVATPLADTYYTLKAINSDGCYDTAGVWIKVLQFPLVPNAFSPNGDGINDTWQISYISSYPDCKIMVFNRYGQAVFTSTGYTRPWDGTRNGNPLPVGTYYYIISTTHLPKPLKGQVTILR
ncbi:MAG TPA: PKD domain-containing protein [Chitinophagaceae bacterium]|nr:PKD domain-containing protein [Chitinophagaceae bacterium]